MDSTEVGGLSDNEKMGSSGRLKENRVRERRLAAAAVLFYSVTLTAVARTAVPYRSQ